MSSSRCRRPASPRRASKRAPAANWVSAPTACARAGVRPWLRWRRVGAVDRRTAGARRAGRGSAGRRGRVVHAGVSQRPQHQGRRHLLRAVRRRRRRGRAARRARAGARSPSAQRPNTPGPARSTSWAGRSIRSALAWCCRARCRVSSSSGWRRRLATSSEGARTRCAAIRFPSRRRQGAGGGGDRARTAEGHAARRARSACAATATCRRRACCSCSSARSNAACADQRCSSALGPGFTASFLALESAAGAGHG